MSSSNKGKKLQGSASSGGRKAPLAARRQRAPAPTPAQKAIKPGAGLTPMIDHARRTSGPRMPRYLASLVSPLEHLGTKVPDEFTAPTDTVSSVFNLPLKPVNLGGGSYGMAAIVAPDWSAAVWLPDDDDANTHTHTVPVARISTSTGPVNAVDLITGDPLYTLFDSVPSAYLTAGTQNVVFNLNNPLQTTLPRTVEQLLVPALSSDKQNHYIPCITGSGGFVIVEGTWAGYEAAADLVMRAHATFLLADGSTIDKYADSANNDITSGGAQYWFRKSASITIPANTVGLIGAYWEWLGSVTTVTDFDDLTVTLQSYFPPLTRFTAVAVDNFDTLAREVRAFRPVGCAAVATYAGNMLDNGLIAAGYISGVDDVSDANFPLLPYNRLSKVPNIHDGTLQKGASAFWRPQDMRAFLFSPSTGATDPLARGFLLFAWTATSADILVRLRVEQTYEIISQDPRYTLTASPFNAAELQRTLALMASFPLGFENSSHWAKIRELVKNGAKWAWNNRDAIAGGIRTAAEAASMLAAM